MHKLIISLFKDDESNFKLTRNINYLISEQTLMYVETS